MTRLEMFWWGLAGTFIAELLRLHNLHKSGGSPDLGDCLFSLGFLICGGIVGIGWAETTIKNTIIAGITWPLLVSSMMNPAQAPASGAAVSGLLQVFDPLVAYAQSKPADKAKIAAMSEAARVEMAKRSQSPAELQALAEDRATEVSMAVAGNAAAPEETLRKLMTGDNLAVRRRAVETLKKLGKLTLTDRLREHVSHY